MKKELMDEIQKEMQKKLGPMWEVKRETEQEIGGLKEGIVCQFSGDNYASILYPQDFERALDSGTDIKELAEYLTQGLKEDREFLLKAPKTQQEFRDALFVQVINADVNKGLLEETVHDIVNGDVAAVARCRIDTGREDEMASFLVTKENMAAFQMTQGEVMEQAYKNMSVSQKFLLQKMEDIMKEAMEQAGIPAEMIPDMSRDGVEMYVLTNPERRNGASAMVCPEVLRDAYKELGEPFYVLPSSTHELILVKESIDMKPEELKQMVHDVNLSEVASEDLLSFQVFHYDGKKLSIAKEDVQKLSDTVEKVKNHSLLH